MMIIDSSDQVPRTTLLKRFPVPRNFAVGPESRIQRGKTWPAPAGAVRVKTFEVYRYNPDTSSAAEVPRRRRAAAVRTAERGTPSPTARPREDDGRCGVLTLGHSTRPIEAFVELLRAHRVTQLIDVRTVPRSRHNPQFNTETLPGTLAALNIGYEHAPGLGGFRRTTPDSPNAGWHNLSFRGYADYMQSADFAAHLAGLIELAHGERVALMCAEAVPWRCHRSLIADALVVHGISTCEIVSPTRLQAHKLTPFACVHGTTITYPSAASDTSVAADGKGCV